MFGSPNFYLHRSMADLDEEIFYSFEATIPGSEEENAIGRYRLHGIAKSRKSTNWCSIAFSQDRMRVSP